MTRGGGAEGGELIPEGARLPLATVASTNGLAFLETALWAATAPASMTGLRYDEATSSRPKGEGWTSPIGADGLDAVDAPSGILAMAGGPQLIAAKVPRSTARETSLEVWVVGLPDRSSAKRGEIPNEGTGRAAEHGWGASPLGIDRGSMTSAPPEVGASHMPTVVEADLFLSSAAAVIERPESSGWVEEALEASPED
ncbi:hypothetical protein THAOC_32597 [Thalassiosira oceanica]|uniref:Uncharacterized protein n=1 Tax=Thalassiosira oceanica TaxID=159749 RepID=K0R6U5_THAOC|nr:hypothetical protein THAOC_32597 [Thalassiosira oceanica]|eukprot:EJK48590.1 hypothetical protein THAOC_32597 [Thalassiosira oceanica]